jgi:hypothetical protein
MFHSSSHGMSPYGCVSLLPNIDYSKAAARERHQVAQMRPSNLLSNHTANVWNATYSGS